MKDMLGTETLEQMASTVAQAWAARAASVETRIEAAATRAQAMTARLRARHEIDRFKALRTLRRTNGDDKA